MAVRLLTSASWGIPRPGVGRSSGQPASALVPGTILPALFLSVTGPAALASPGTWTGICVICMLTEV